MNTITPSPELIARLKSNRGTIIATLNYWFEEYDTDIKTLMTDFMLWVAQCSEQTQKKIATEKGAKEAIKFFYSVSKENYETDFGKLDAIIEADKANKTAFFKSLEA